MSSIPKTSQYAVAFIDFLGVREMMAKDEDGHDLIVFNAACKAAIGMCREILGSDEERVTFKMFSDNILLCRRVRRGDAESALRRVALAAAMFQYFILDTMGALVRGGITVGELYIDSTMAWGSSLVTAYKLESERAIYPRIIADPELPQELLDSLAAEEALRLDEDGLYYLDYLHTVWKFHRAQDPEAALTLLNDRNLEELTAHMDNDEVCRKRRWQSRYLDHIGEKWLAEDKKLPAANGQADH